MNKISNWVKYCLEALPCENGYVLDLACGKGRHSIFLSNLGYNVLSVDIDEYKMNSFNGKLIKKKVIDVENINNWPLEKEKFDAIIVTNFLNRKIFLPCLHCAVVISLQFLLGVKKRILISFKLGMKYLLFLLLTRFQD